MKKKTGRTSQTLRLLKWIRSHSGLWYLICTPDEGHMNSDMMKRLVERLYQEHFYELIFVLLTVHRKNPCFSCLPEYLLLDSFIARWNDDSDGIIDEMLTILE